ncbi:MAG: rhamnulokinase [Prevotella sp.]|nr:rhamnulokinase [Prevotella sp.]
MNKARKFFAADLGATSGRTILGTIVDGRIEIEELTRFPNNLIETGGHVYWDIFALYNEIIGGLRLVAQRGEKIESIGIDTWGVDFVCVGQDGALLRNPLAYRDPHTFAAIDDYLKHVVKREHVYELTGIQFMNFNSLYQLHAMRSEGNVALEQAEKILFVPDALSYMLTDEAVCEYTIASTSQMLDPHRKELSSELLASVSLEREKFGRMVMPGTPIGRLTREVQRITGLPAVPVIAVAGHDTGSAVAAVPAKDERFAYLSSGTWSLMGIETKKAVINARSYELDFTNEGGIEGTTRFLKNICGMWLYERCRKEWKEKDGEALSHAELQLSAMEAEAFRSIINPDDAMFANPSSMVEAIQSYCRQTSQPIPETPAEICRCIFDSLALRYRQVFGWLKEFSPVPLDVLHIIGGGSLNKYLNQMTADACQVVVLAGPQEGTALGNIMMQAKAGNLVNDIWEMRHIIANSLDLQRFEPKEKEKWDVAFEKFLAITER